MDMSPGRPAMVEDGWIITPSPLKHIRQEGEVLVSASCIDLPRQFPRRSAFIGRPDRTDSNAWATYGAGCPDSRLNSTAWSFSSRGSVPARGSFADGQILASNRHSG